MSYDRYYSPTYPNEPSPLLPTSSKPDSIQLGGVQESVQQYYSQFPLEDMWNLQTISPSDLSVPWPDCIQIYKDEDDLFNHPQKCVRPIDTGLATSSLNPPGPSSSDSTTPATPSLHINKLNSLINRLQELASSAPADHRFQLFNKVAALRETFKKQQERCIEFLQLSEDYANKYLLDLDAEIRQQSTHLDNLEERLEAAKKLHGDAIVLQMLYESGTAASMNDLLVTGISRPLPQDDALFKEVDFVMAEIRLFDEEVNKFWREEICCVVEALKKRCVDPRDFERWNGFRSSLK